MLNLHKSLFIILTALIITTSALAMEDAILAIVDDEVITLKDLRDYMQSTYVNLVSQGMDEKRINEILLDLEINGIDKLIEDKLILNKANSMQMEVREKVVDERLSSIKDRYTSEQEFLDALVAEGSNITDIKTKIRNQLKIQYLVELQVKSKIFVNPQEVTDYYNNNIEAYRKKESVELDTIFVAYKDNKLTAKNKALEALGKINQGEDFRKIAKEYSDSPSIGTVEKGQFMPVIENSIFKLNENQVSGLVHVETGIYIFKLNKKIPAEIAPIIEVKESISNLLYKQKFKKQFKSWLDELKENAYIEIKK